MFRVAYARQALVSLKSGILVSTTLLVNLNFYVYNLKKAGNLPHANNVVVVFAENRKLQFLQDDDARNNVTKRRRQAKVVDS